MDAFGRGTWVAESTTMTSSAFASITIMENKNDSAVIIYRIIIYIIYRVAIRYLPVPKREVSMAGVWGLKPLKRQMKVSWRLRDMSRTFIR